MAETSELTQAQNESRIRFETFVFEKMAQSRLPGLSLALVRNGDIEYARGFGQRDLHNGLPATPDTLYSIGSITKSFTALAIMQLADEGLLDPTDPVERFVPFPFRPFGETVTLEHLLAHTSGIPALGYSEALIGHFNQTGGRWLPISGPEDVLTFMEGAQEWTESRPGERWAYANEGYAILGLVVEKVSGRPYGEYLKERILAPLGMTRTFLDSLEVEESSDVAVPYVLPQGESARPGRYLYRRIRSEGGLISSVRDLVRYAGVYLEGGKGLVSSDSLSRMTQPSVALPHRRASELLGGEGPGEPAQQYGYGLMIEEFMGRQLVGHGGSVLVSTAHLAVLPSEGLGVAVLANGSGYPMAHIARAALAFALGGQPTDLEPVRLEQELEKLTGRYRSYRSTMTASVERRGNFLELVIDDLANPQRTILVPQRLAVDSSEFYTLTEGRRLPVTFRPSNDQFELLFERYKFRRVGPL